jgi:heme-degrading monooxygenase HmoA
MPEEPSKVGKKEGSAMFARVTTMNTTPERVDEGIAIYKKSVVPAARSQKGFIAAYLLVDRHTGKAMSVALWKTEEDALANEHNRYYQEQIIKFLDLYVTAPIREGYEVAVEA